MSQFNQTPPPSGQSSEGTRSSQGPGYNGQQAPPSAPYGAPQQQQQQQSHKSGATAAFDKYLNQAVTTGKPMLNKLGKTISSKLGSKQQTPSTPQHLESYQNYQQHQQNQHQTPNQNQSFSPQPSQQQWQQPQQLQPQQPQNAYPSPQQSPYSQAQSQYATPTSGHPGQANYFPPQISQPPAPPPPSQSPNAPSYNPNQYTQPQGASIQQQGPQQYGQVQQGQGQPPQGSYQGTPSLQNQQAYGQYPGQQTGVNATSQSPVSNVQTGTYNPQQGQNQQQHQQWAPPTPAPTSATPVGQSASPAPLVPQGQSFNTSLPPQQYGVINQQHQPQQQWSPIAPLAPHNENSSQVPPSASPPPQHSATSPHPPPAVPISTHPGQQPGQHPGQHLGEHLGQPPPAQSSETAQTASAPPASTDFVAELPADLGSLSVMENSKPSQSQSQYQAYQPPSAGQSPSPAQSFTIPRRTVSWSTLPLADPWRIADPVTETPTREFLILADLLFNALDRKFEPQNTGLLEASKILESWKAQGMEGEAAQLFAHDSYSAFSKLWSLEGIPHIMVPRLPSLMPLWNFQSQSHSQEIRLTAEPAPADAPYSPYLPALNRAGWYKFAFLEALGEPGIVDKMLAAFCADTYKPGILNQPDLQRQDRAELPGLAGRAKAIRGALGRVCQETAAAMHRGGASVSHDAKSHAAPQN